MSSTMFRKGGLTIQMAKKKSIKTSVATTDTITSITGEQTDAKNVASTSVGKTQGDNTVEASQIKEEKLPQTVINTSKVAELVGGGATPSTGVASSMLRAAGRINYGGGADQIAADNSAKPEGRGIYKSGDRPGRTMDTALSHLDDTPAETYIVPIESIPMLKDGQSTVGYSGNYRNEHAISQKGSGGSPADSDFFRTVDEMQYDMIYFGTGQQNFQIADDASILKVDKYTSTNQGGSWSTFDVYKGNYVQKKMVAKFNANGVLQSLQFTSDNYHPRNEDRSDTVLRVAGDAYLRDNNNYELDRINMINTASDETKDNFSFLGKTIPNARTTNAVLGEMDKIIGDYLYVASDKLSKSLSYQINKAAKDGQRKLGPILEMCNGNVTGTTYRLGSVDDDDVNLENLFAYGSYRNPDMAKGSALLYIAIQDSTKKYNTKAKFLSLPLSFKTALSTYKQNCGEFRMHNTLYSEYNRQEVFGKVDEDGSGITPYFLSDGAQIVEPINIFQNDLAKYSIADPITTLHYEDIRNKYNVPVYNYLIAGLRDYLKRHGSRIVGQLSEGSDHYYTLEVPVTSTVSCLSLWDILLCAASKDIAIHRRYAMDCVIDYESKNHAYPYHNALKLSEVNVGGTTNVGFSDTSSPLQSRNIPLNVATRILLPEVFWPIGYAANDSLDGVGGSTDHKGTVAAVVLPYYFNQNQFVPNKVSNTYYKWELNPEEMSSMTFFDYRGGIRLSNADRIKAMDPEQLKLSLDRMVIPPNMGKQLNEDDLAFSSAMYPATYKYSYHEDGIPVMNYWVASASSSDADHRLTIGDVVSTPRELGLSFIAPAGVVVPTRKANDTVVHYNDISDGYFRNSGPSFRARIWSSTAKANIGKTLFDQHRDGTYGVNLMANWFMVECNADDAVTDIGIKFSSANNDGTSAYNAAGVPIAEVIGNGDYSYTAGTYNAAEAAANAKANSIYGTLSLTSALKVLYPRMNIFPFLINPFDTNVLRFSGSETTASNAFSVANRTDIFDLLHLFNMCGFRCGEYKMAEYDRNRDRIQKGIGYVDDPYITNRM